MNRWIQMGFIAAGIGLLVAVALHAASDKTLGVPVAAGPGSALAGPRAPAGALDPRPMSKPAPDFGLPDPNGKIVRLSALRGRWVLLNFWATWCAPCREELPQLAALAQKLAESPIQLVLVSVDKSFTEVTALADDIDRAAERHASAALWKKAGDMLRGKLPNTVSLLDAQAATPQAYGTSKYPETYLIDPQGKVALWFIGPKPWGHPEAIALIEKAIQPTDPGT